MLTGPPVTIVLPYPVSTNRYWGERVVPKANGRPAFVQRYLTPEAREYRQAAVRICAAFGVVEPFPWRVLVHAQVYPHRPLDWKKRMREHGEAWDDTVQCIDTDNGLKVILDALKGVAFLDDKWCGTAGPPAWSPTTRRSEPS